MSDQDSISHNNTNRISVRQVLRMMMNINWEIISWFNTKFSKMTSEELYNKQLRELLMTSCNG